MILQNFSLSSHLMHTPSILFMLLQPQHGAQLILHKL
ncbi:unnamed protein product [Linum tenue]|uniref:Uncharacterized protein n=1 Tax=Linum tenue TaxID=586396 RepID=A0AAV0S7I4_9ROSI|nr:unnamed protein product [Linum tenue]